jgi:hypothetical protein
MEKITWEYMEGVPAMVNLANMLGTAIAEALPEEQHRRTAGWNWIGYYLGEGADILFGVRYQEPLNIVFENNRGNDPTFQRELVLPDVHFFSLTAGEGFAVGRDAGAPVTPDYAGEHPWALKGGTIKKVIADVSGEAYVDLEKEAIAAMKRD